MQPTTERREFLRADMNVFLNEESRTARMLAKTVDISERGIHYVMPMTATGRDSTEVTLEFCLPGDEQPVHVLGRVVYDRSDRFKQATAIEFTMLDSSDAERIRRYVGARKRAELFEQMRSQHLLQ